MVKDGYYFGLPPLALGAAALFLRWTVPGAILLCLAAFVFYFSRDPERIIPADAGAIVSPADGRVVVVTDEENAGQITTANKKPDPNQSAAFVMPITLRYKGTRE